MSVQRIGKKVSTSSVPASGRRPSQIPLEELSNPLLAKDQDEPSTQPKPDAVRFADDVRRRSSGALNGSKDDGKKEEAEEKGKEDGKKKQEKSGSLIGQIGSLLIGETKDDQANGEEQKGGNGGGGGVSVDAVLGTIACSAVQGMRKAVAAKSIPMKVFWTLMVLLSIGLFIKAMVTISLRLAYVRLEKSYQLDKVPFVFPDLYFCPNNAYSGSFPYNLTEAQAELINQEVERLGQLYDQQFSISGRDNSSRTRVFRIQQSLPIPLLKDYIMHRAEQSMFYKPLITSLGNPNFEVYVFPGTAGNRLCFKILLTDQEREALTLRLKNEDLRLALFSDPYFSDFKYSGPPIKPILNPILNESVPFRVWYPFGIVNMMGSGYTMYTVPIGVYPAMEYEPRLKLAPGKSYDIDLQMEENRFSDELLDKECSSDHETVVFVNPLTRGKMEFNYSYAGCFFTETAKNLHNLNGYVHEGIPISWDLRNSPRWGNLTDYPRINRSKAEYEVDFIKANELRDPVQVCRTQQPCVQNKYTASFSFHSWPNTGGSYSTAFSYSNFTERPALSHMTRMARELDAGSLPIESHAEFRHIISESLLEVRIRAKSPMATRVLMTASYTSTSYLSDLGGLMGLYLGCSVLTLFELLEILYLKAADVIKAKYRKRRGSRSDTGGSREDEVAEELEEDYQDAEEAQYVEGKRTEKVADDVRNPSEAIA